MTHRQLAGVAEMRGDEMICYICPVMRIRPDFVDFRRHMSEL